MSNYSVNKPEGGDINGDLTQAVKTLLSEAADRLNRKQSAASIVQRRAVPVRPLVQGVSAKTIISLDSRSVVLGIPEYDPDYPTALDMLEEERKDNRDGLSNRSYVGKFSTPGITDGTLWENHYTNGEHQRFKSRSFSALEGFAVDAVKPAIKPVMVERMEDSPAVYTGGSAENVFDALNDEYDSRALLRLGIDRARLSDLAQEIHSSFLLSLIGQCKCAASEATSVEELAMHGVLLSKVKSVFADSNIRKLKNEMIAAAAEGGLKSMNHR
jgi:hypothetical protein